MLRVVRPHEFCQARDRPPSTFSNSMPNIFAKFWPRQWLVAAWMPRPVAGTNASTVVVYRPPANFSFSDFTPWMTGTASSCSYTALYLSRMARTSASASAFVANTVWPSCQRNSRLRMNGVGCLNSQRTTLHHWFSFSGKSRWLRIQVA